MFEEEEKDFQGYRKTPLFKKAMELLELVDHITESVSKTDIDFENEIEREMLEHNLNYMAQNAAIIPAKIAGAYGADLYDLKMENAAIVRKAARELNTDATGIQMH